MVGIGPAIQIVHQHCELSVELDCIKLQSAFAIKLLELLAQRFGGEWGGASSSA